MPPEHRLRVLLVPSAYYPHVGGIEELTRQLALHLQARGHRVLVLTNQWPAQTASRELLDGVAVRRIPMELPAASPHGLARFAARGPRSAAQLLSTVRRFRPDVIHLQGAGPNAAYFAALRRLIPAPVVLTTQGEYGFDAHGVFERSLTLRTGLRHLLRRADAVTACSQFVLDELGADGEVVPNGVDPRDFEVARPEVNGLGRYVFAAARLAEQKGLDVLLHAFTAAPLDGRRLVIAGDGPERASLERLAGTLGLDERVTFLGAVGRSQLASVLRGSDVFAFPSRREPFGIALLEAMAAEVPAVATRAGGIPEFARDGENALLVPPDDAAGLASALVRLVREPELCARLVRGGRATTSLLDWDRLTPRYEQVYRRVMRPEGVPSIDRVRDDD